MPQCRYSANDATPGARRARARRPACRSPGTSCSGARDPVKLLTDAARQGDVVRLDLPGRTYLLSHPAAREARPAGQPPELLQGLGVRSDQAVLGREPAHRRRRHVAAAAAPGAAVVQARPHGRLRADRHRAARPRCSRAGTTVAASGQPLALYNEMTELALVIIGDVLFGVDLWARRRGDGRRGAVGAGGAEEARRGAGAAAALGPDQRQPPLQRRDAPAATTASRRSSRGSATPADDGARASWRC